MNGIKYVDRWMVINMQILNLSENWELIVVKGHERSSVMYVMTHKRLGRDDGWLNKFSSKLTEKNQN